ncbi:hypothetical protein CIHG_02789 [Coccidioides immitis H538.4]|uniref:Uncharacterized protein n=3 Tax=Coccidioides immitis TaxID=5501 RepID=A0A0J8QH21_COCIT|nr:hypothetical protein CIRG_07505 [Coccidioides immitis RMSCC 2394]KMU71715.1 hypothetical protein CISG_00025 [Coccidioides immitis RMSCC 3703]KMU85006.1 hypothetical protein CIHG_02789 [Coccidioides immitis H538.4]
MRHMLYLHAREVIGHRHIITRRLQTLKQGQARTKASCSKGSSYIGNAAVFEAFPVTQRTEGLKTSVSSRQLESIGSTIPKYQECGFENRWIFFVCNGGKKIASQQSGLAPPAAAGCSLSRVVARSMGSKRHHFSKKGQGESKLELSIDMQLCCCAPRNKHALRLELGPSGGSPDRTFKIPDELRSPTAWTAVFLPSRYEVSGLDPRNDVG